MQRYFFSLGENVSLIRINFRVKSSTGLENQFRNSEADELLLEQLRQGDRLAFEALYNRYWEDMLGIAYRVFPDRELCMDILQDVFVRLWTHREFLAVRHLRNYLVTAVKYQVANHLRREKVNAKYLQHSSSEETYRLDSTVEVKEMQALIQHFATQLPQRCGEVFYLSRVRFKSNREIAEELGISEKTVEMHLTTALKRLRMQLDRYAFLLFFL